PAGDWSVLARADDGRPLIARVPYGAGQITFLAFSFEDPSFVKWDGRVDFLRGALAELAPRTGQNLQNVNNNMPNFGFGERSVNDVQSRLLRKLDNFDVRVIPFGFVALFIILYVLIVGPVEFFVLKYVFGRLEWTWVTFPVVVVTVSV